MAHRHPWRRALLILGVLAVLVSGGVPAASGQPVTLRYFNWGLGEEPWGSYVREMAKAFQKANPQIKLSLEAIGFAEKDKVFATQAEAGRAPDVAVFLSESMGAFVERGYLLDLAPFLKRDTSDFAGIFYEPALRYVSRGPAIFGVPFTYQLMIFDAINPAAKARETLRFAAIPTKKTPATAINAGYHVIAKSSQHAEEAWRFVRFLTSNEAYKRAYEVNSWVVARKDTNEWIRAKGSPFDRVMIEELGTARFFPATPKWPEITNALIVAVQEAEPDGPGDQLLARPGRPLDQGREVAHPRVERAPVAPQVMREDRLPDRGAEPLGRPREAEDVGVDLVEGAPHLEEAREEVRGLAGGRRRVGGGREEVAKVLAEPPVEPGACGRPRVVADQAVARAGVWQEACSPGRGPPDRRTGGTP